MKKLTSLLKIDLINTYFIRNKKGRGQAYLLGLIGLLLLGLYLPYIYILDKIYHLFNILGQESAFLYLAFLVFTVLNFIFSFSLGGVSLYMSNDIRSLAPLPVKSETIVLSKLITILLGQYLIGLFFLGPIGFYYFKDFFSLLGILYMILGLLLLPIIPLALSTILISLLLRLTSGLRSRNIIILLGNIGLIAIVLGFQFFLNRSLNLASNQDMLGQLVKNSNFIIDSSKTVFFYLAWLAKAIADKSLIKGLAYILAFIGFNLAAFYLLVKVSASQLIKLALEGPRESGKLAIKDLNLAREFKSSSKIKAMAKKEWLNLIRTPFYLINLALTIFILPFFLFILRLTGGSDPQLVSGLELLRELLDSYNLELILFYGLAGSFIMGISNLSSTSFSREGREFYIQEIIPISPREQLLARGLVHLTSFILTNLVNLTIVYYLTRKNFLVLGSALLFAILFSLPLLVLSFTIDIARPKLDWLSPNQVLKRNPNPLAASLISVAYGAGLAYLAYKTRGLVSPAYCILGLSLLSIVLTITMVKVFEMAYNKTIGDS